MFATRSVVHARHGMVGGASESRKDGCAMGYRPGYAFQKKRARWKNTGAAKQTESRRSSIPP
jgi:hypothetical protein